MTPLEWARLQGFAGYAFMENGIDLFSFPDGIPEGQKYKQLGNSVFNSGCRGNGKVYVKLFLCVRRVRK